MPNYGQFGRRYILIKVTKSYWPVELHILLWWHGPGLLTSSSVIGIQNNIPYEKKRKRKKDLSEKETCPGIGNLPWKFCVEVTNSDDFWEEGSGM